MTRHYQIRLRCQFVLNALGDVVQLIVRRKLKSRGKGRPADRREIDKKKEGSLEKENMAVRVVADSCK